MRFCRVSGNCTTKPEAQSQITDSDKSQKHNEKEAPKRQEESSAMNKGLLDNHLMHIRLYA